jgi:type II secretory pathway pseudopilin PulG
MTGMDKNRGGFMLVELAIVVAVLGLLIGGTATFLKGQYVKNKGDTTIASIKVVKDALDEYRKVNLLLPCPAKQTLAVSEKDYGKSDCTLKVGSIPTKELGISSKYSMDGYGYQLTYGVSKGLTDGTSRTGTLKIKEASNYSLVTEAADYAIVSHNKDGFGAYNSAGILVKPCNDNAAERENCNGDDTFVEGQQIIDGNKTAANYYNDTIEWKGQIKRVDISQNKNLSKSALAVVPVDPNVYIRSITGLQVNWLSNTTLQMRPGSFVEAGGRYKFDISKILILDIMARGLNGLDVGSPVEGWYAIYAIGKLSTGEAGFILSRENSITKVTKPEGFGYIRKMPLEIFWDGHYAKIREFQTTSAAGYDAATWTMVNATGEYNLLDRTAGIRSGFNGTNFVKLDGSKFVPDSGRMVRLMIKALWAQPKNYKGPSYGDVIIRPGSGNVNGFPVLTVGNGGAFGSVVYELATNSSEEIAIRTTNPNVYITHVTALGYSSKEP